MLQFVSLSLLSFKGLEDCALVSLQVFAPNSLRRSREMFNMKMRSFKGLLIPFI